MIQLKVIGEKIKKERIVFILLILCVLFIILLPVENIEIGECGVLYNKISGSIENSKVENGWHFIVPFVQQITKYPITERIYNIERNVDEWSKGNDTSFWVTTNDNEKIKLDLCFSYIIDKDSLDTFFTNYKGQSVEYVEKEYFDIIFKKTVTFIVNKYSVFEVYSQKRADIENEIFDLLKKEFSKLPVILKTAMIKEVYLTPEVEGIVKAESKSRAAIIEAQGKKEANRLISDSLTEKIIKMNVLEKLSSKLELIVIPNDYGDLDLDTFYNKLITGEYDKDNSKNNLETQQAPVLK